MHLQYLYFEPSFKINTAKMSMISMLGVTVPKNPAPFKDDYEFEITFECLQEEGLEKGKNARVLKIPILSRLSHLPQPPLPLRNNH